MTKFRIPGDDTEPPAITITTPMGSNILPFEVKLGINALDEIAAIERRSDILAAFEEDQQRSDLESNARITIIKMFTEAPALDQNFTFKTARGKGEDYVQAIRQVLSRGRQKLRSAQNTQPAHFKLFLVGIERLEDHDLVTIVRSARPSIKMRSVMDDIADLVRNEIGD